MRNLVGIIAILFVTATSSSAAEYWHFGVGLKGTAVIPGENYSNAYGVGVIASFGDPDSKFTTQFDLDSWKVIYDFDISGDTLAALEHHYSGLGVGIYEKYRIFDMSSRFSPYVIGGLGAYFLELKREDLTDIQGLQLRSQYLHSILMMAGGLGIEAGFNDRISAFIEGRYVYLNSDRNEDKDIIHSYLGIRYRF